ncbi:MAG: hypothetical protein ACKVIR_06675, partial [Candidatus Poseidoniales archaeon]
TDGSDEPQHDASGNETSYYMCEGGETILLSYVNDGDEDCMYGDDEADDDTGEDGCQMNWPEDPFHAAIYAFIAEYELYYGASVGCYFDDYPDLTYEDVAMELENNWSNGTALEYAQAWVDSNAAANWGEDSFNLTLVFMIPEGGLGWTDGNNEEHSGWVEFDNEDAIFDGGGYYYFSNSLSIYDLEENQSYSINISIYDNNGDLFGSLEYYNISASTSSVSMNITEGCYYAGVVLYDGMGNYIDDDWMDLAVGDADCDGGSEDRMYECADGTMSIYFDEVNDGFADCTDYSDEPQYDAETGEEYTVYYCEHGNETIPLSWVNDGDEDCEYGDDEPDGDNNGEDRMYLCADGFEMTYFEYVNDGDEDCEDGSDEPQYDASGNEISEYMCEDGETIPLSYVNDGNEDCPEGDDESDENGGEDDDCVSMSILFEVIGDSDNAQFEMSTVCEFDEDTSDMWRMFMDMTGNNDSIVTQDEVDNLLAMLSEEDEEDEEDNESEDWFADGVMLSMTLSPSFSNAIGIGNISFLMTQTSEMFSMVDGQSTITISSDISDDGPDDDCTDVVIQDSENWNVTSVEMSSTTWTVSDEGDHFSAFGCGNPGMINLVFTYNVEEIVEEIVDQAPMCMVEWTYSTDTNWESGTELIVDASGDHTLEMSPGNYYLGIFCTDDEGDVITISLSTADGSLSATQTGSTDVSGWVDLTIPEGLTATIPVDYQWDSGDFNGAGTITVSFTSEAGEDGNATIDDIETDSGGFLPGFTSILTISAMMGAVMFLSRREEE